MPIPKVRYPTLVANRTRELVSYRGLANRWGRLIRLGNRGPHQSASTTAWAALIGLASCGALSV